MKFYKIFFLLLIQNVASQDFSKSFELEAYLGKWYQVYSNHYVQNTFEKGSRCVKAFYDILDNGNIDIYYQQINIDNTIDSTSGSAYIPNENEPRKLKTLLNHRKEEDYWIYELGPIVDGKYKYSIVSNKQKTTLFVFARDVNDFFENYNIPVLKKLRDFGFVKIWNRPLQTLQNCY